MSFQWVYDAAADCWCVGPVNYCSRPKNPDLQALRIFVPAGYMKDGAPDPAAVVTVRGGAQYTAATAPIVLYNDIGGYAECRPAGLFERNRRFLDDGFVLVSVGARGRQSANETDAATGKAPAALVDLKAAVRWLRAHSAELPGDCERIFSVGTSAGGAMSSLLGVSGNCKSFLPYLEDIGAENGRDDIFAAQCYCPITDLEHADMAYEWMFGAKKIYTFSPRVLPGVLTADQQKLSGALAAAFPAYVNSLSLGLTLGQDGRSGSYYEALLAEIEKSLNKFLQLHGSTAEEQQALLEELDGGSGAMLWQDGRAVVPSLDKYVRSYIRRMKACPAFDPFDGGSPENQEFGDSTKDKKHFSLPTAEIMAELGLEGADARLAEVQSAEMRKRTALMNPLKYISGELESQVAPHFRIRLGSKDADTSFAIGFDLYLALRASGRSQADYGLVWGRGHCDADYPGEFSAWVNGLCR